MNTDALGELWWRIAVAVLPIVGLLLVSKGARQAFMDVFRSPNRRAG